MPNPYALLIGLAAWFFSSAAAFNVGVHYNATRTAAALEKAVAAAVADAQEKAAIDYGVQQQLALEAQKRELLHSQKSRAVVVAVAADKSAADCKLGAPAYGVLLDSLDSANGASGAAAGAGDGAVPAGGAAGRQQPGGGGVRTGQHGVDALDVQSTAQTAR